ncbi:MAG: PAS domain S-box protein [Saprospiraceae bacterium]
MKISSDLLTGIFVIALFVLLFFMGVAYRQIESIKASERLISHSYDVNLELVKLFSILKDAESGQRGFILTKDSMYFRQYISSWKASQNSMDRLRVLVRGVKSQQITLDTLFQLIALRKSILETSMQLADGHVIVPESVIQKMGEGSQDMEMIRTQINYMTENEKELLTIWKYKYKSQINFAPITYLLVILFAILIFIFSFFKISKDGAELKKVNNQVIRINTELSKQNSIFNLAEETANIGSFVWDLNTREVKYSANMYKMLGYSAEEFVPNLENFLKLVHPDDQERAIKETAEISKSGHFIQSTYRIFRKDNQLRYFTTNGKSIDHENRHVLIGTFQDITDSVEMNQRFLTKNAELKKSEDRYHLMVSEVQDYSIILLNNEGIIQNWNKGAEKIKGYTEEEIIGKPLSVFYSKEDIARKLPEQLLEEASLNGKATHAGWRIRKDGSRFWGNVVITTLHDEDNNIIGFTKVTRDLTAQKEAEERLLEYNRSIEKKNIELLASNEEIASFNHIASHDLQEPLRKIQTFISRITREDSEHISEKGKEYFARISTSADRMQHLIDDLITYTHTNRADKVFIRTDLNSLLSTVLDELKPSLEEKKAVIKTEHLPTLSVIPFQFEQLFTNLIDNSLKYSRQNVNPVISITSSIVDANKVPGASLTSRNKFHKITVSDNGIGFEKQYAETIFTLFQRLHGKSEYSGTGIGLAICKKIVEKHSGTISAESIPNEGSQFHIFIPIET